MTPSQLLTLLFAPLDRGDGANVKSFLDEWGPAPHLPAHLGSIDEQDASAFARLAWVAVRADRRSMAGAAGHQAAIRRLFPSTPKNAITAFCVSEDHGPRPSKIMSSLAPDGDGWVLNGLKRWGSMAPDADLLYVAASVGRHDDGRNDLRMVALPSDRPGLSKDETPYAEKYPEMKIADLYFSDVPVKEEEVFDTDAYDAFIKPFRLVEDVYGTAATQIGLVRLARDYDWPEEIIEDLTALVLQAQTIAATTMETPEEVILISSYFRASADLWSRLEECWTKVPETERVRWSPDIGLLEIAARAREARRQSAWQALTAP